MKTDNKSRYSLAKKEVSQFLKRLKVPKFEMKKQTKSVKSERFSVFIYDDGIDRDKCLTAIAIHNFKLSIVEDRQYCMAGAYVYFVVRKNKLNREERYKLAKKEVLDFLYKLNIPKEKHSLTEQPPFGKIDRFNVFFTDDINIKDVSEHNFRYSRIDDKEHYINAGTIVYFVVRKIRKAN